MHGGARAGKSGAHGANGDFEQLGDGAIVEAGLLVKGQCFALLGRQRVDDGSQPLTGFVRDGDVQGIVATLVQLAVLGRDVFVAMAARGGAAKMAAPVNDGATEPASQMGWRARFMPQCNQAFLHGIVGEVVATKDASRHGPQSW